MNSYNNKYESITYYSLQSLSSSSSSPSSLIIYDFKILKFLNSIKHYTASTVILKKLKLSIMTLLSSFLSLRIKQNNKISSIFFYYFILLSSILLIKPATLTLAKINISDHHDHKHHINDYYPISLAKIYQFNDTISDNIDDSKNFNKIDYTNHSIIKILNPDVKKIFKDEHDFGENYDPNDNHEILWYDKSDVNNTYAFVRIGPKSLKRVRRDLQYLREQPLYLTSNLQSWLDAEHDHHNKNNFAIPSSSSLHSFHLPGNDILNNIDEIDEDDEPVYNINHQSSSINSRVAGFPAQHSKIVPSFVLNRYYPIAQVNRYLKDIAQTYPSTVTVFTIGHTHENRPIQAIEILNNPNDPNFLFIDACTHAREWVTVTTALYVIDQAIFTKIPINFIIIPVLNVDGYVYTWTKDRMWRKNRRPYVGSRISRHSMPERCTGVDLNRNYDINFGGTGSSKNPCSFLYQGPFPFSEPEVRAVRDLLSTNRHRIKMTLSLHSFNQLWSCPNAFTTELTKDHKHHMRVLRSIQQAVRQQNGVLYDIGPLGSRLYLGSGFMMDWIYHKLGIRDAYLVELRDRGFYGFMLPADQIWPTATETWAGIQAAIQHIFL